LNKIVTDMAQVPLADYQASATDTPADALSREQALHHLNHIRSLAQDPKKKLNPKKSLSDDSD
jgi:hypothetical protein